ncbi:unnamed protein product [Bemisia tabaci]|uniref:Zinc finger protein n=1 Tax=Bemisia tabaci TaxID=7038 RepID=A0A9P0F687_BEMTA|nr:unnamed protein product [Bemisia tabaci]
MNNQFSLSYSSNLCRLCGMRKSLVFDLYSPDSMQSGLLTKINTFLPKDVISLDVGDALPKLICSDCKMTIYHFSEFAQNVKKAQNILLDQMLQKKSRFTNTAKCHTTGVSTRSQQVVISVGSDLKILCEDCQTYLEVRELATLHLVTHGLGNVICSCRECGHRDEIGFFLQSNNDSILCPQCLFANLQTSTVNVYNDHSEPKVNKKDSKKVYTCDSCSKVFYHKGHLERHRLIHDGLRPYLCETCGCGFNQRSSLKTHLLSHNKQNPFTCDWCQQSFRFKISLQSHILNMHSSALPEKKSHECDQCKKQFATLHKLKRHYRCHSGERPYQCNVCNRSFSQKFNLNTHLKKHEAVDDFDETFTSDPILQNPPLSSYDPQPMMAEKCFINLDSGVINHQNYCLLPSDDCAQSNNPTGDIFDNYSDTYSLFVDQPQTSSQKLLPMFPSLNSNPEVSL